MSICTAIDLRFTGGFSLAESVQLATRAAFAEGMRLQTGTDRFVFDLAFPLEGSWSTVAVSVEQHDHRVRALVLSNSAGVTHDDIRIQLERILSLDIDGVGFRSLAADDHVVAALQKRRPGVRPVLFPSPYEAAARAIIGHRLPARQAAAVHSKISAEHGSAVQVNGARIHAFPAPVRLATLPPVAGLAERKVEQLRALGVAAAEGWLDSVRLRAMDHDAALAHLQQLAGIGPFSAELILLRGAGDPDAFPRTETRLHNAMVAAYGLGERPDIQTLERIADRWRPYRSWVGLLLRNQ